MQTCMQIILQMAANTKNMWSSKTFLLQVNENYHNDKLFHFDMQRWQFPVQISFRMTASKEQEDLCLKLKSTRNVTSNMASSILPWAELDILRGCESSPNLNKKNTYSISNVY